MSFYVNLFQSYRVVKSQVFKIGLSHFKKTWVLGHHGIGRRNMCIHNMCIFFSFFYEHSKKKYFCNLNNALINVGQRGIFGEYLLYRTIYHVDCGRLILPNWYNRSLTLPIAFEIDVDIFHMKGAVGRFH